MEEAYFSPHGAGLTTICGLYILRVSWKHLLRRSIISITLPYVNVSGIMGVLKMCRSSFKPCEHIFLQFRQIV